MSHTVTIETEVRDTSAIEAACKRSGAEFIGNGLHKLFSESVSGNGVKLRDWNYPVVFDTETGASKFDNFNERWGKQAELDSFLQSYAIEKAKIEARKAGHTVREQSQADGSVKLTISVGV